MDLASLETLVLFLCLTQANGLGLLSNFLDLISFFLTAGVKLQNNRTNSERRKYDVLIVGAGIAGLSAAEYLIKNGVTKVAILEAKSRIGGRVHTKFINGNPLEIGAQWIHGAHEANIVYNIAVENGLANGTCETLKGPTFLSNGKEVDKSLVNKLFEEIESFENLESNDSLEVNLENEFKNISQKFQPNDRDMMKKVFNFYKIQTMFDEGDELDKLSARSDYKSYPCDLDIYGGLNKLVKLIANRVGESRIFKQHEVLNIDYSKNQVLIKVKNGKTIKHFQAKFAISTVSLGFLKANSASLFTPKLPERKLIAINHLVFGRGVKIFLFYNKPFWKRNQLLKLKLAISNEDYVKGKKEWIHRVAYFEEMTDCPNVLLTTVFGDVAEEVELMNKSEINEKLTNLLRNYTNNIDLLKADKIITSKWTIDRFVLGTYSVPGISSDREDFETISEPLPNSDFPKLLFAGEATSRTHYSTLHGSRESGIREAIRIIDRIKATNAI
ncbi:peroxisomal N(1)-acetyl-spermine/spermidine oxidase-like protein [Dinothrombium tinctorium]|uniref:Amine oxidase n=1 Tax=Dinothrombium tinctorium TaxID=1965070 RepID=A0A3S3NTL3_9ACAR|nr:peroxisomal N(1)-acetyl-spermine/spermidine oxidase-like protein [Dinothrombium tinctorium]